MKRWTLGLRMASLALALLAVIDPAITLTRRSRPVLALIATNPVQDRLLLDRIKDRLEGKYRLLNAPLPAADATLLIGDQLPSYPDLIQGPLFALLPASTQPTLRIEAAEVPPLVDLNELVSASLRVKSSSGNGKSLVLSLFANGVPVRSDTFRIETADTLLQATLSFSPPDTGMVHLQVRAGWMGSPVAAVTDLVTEVQEQPHQVFFYDTRPGWMSTFLRRLLESKPAFQVTARTLTSTTLSTDVGTPTRLDQPGALERFSLVIVGSAEALKEVEIRALDRWVRQSGGSLILLLDSGEPGPWQQLPGVSTWQHDSNKVVSIHRLDGDTASILSTVVSWPATLPTTATRLASDSLDRPLLWQVPLGLGTVWINGAIDSWRARDPSVTGFESFWGRLLEEAAATALPHISGSLKQSVLPFGESTTFTGTVRQAATDIITGSPSEIQILARLEPVGTADREIISLQLVPGPEPGSFSGLLQPPHRGFWRLRIRAGAEELVLPLLVLDSVAVPSGSATTLKTWVSAQGGKVLSAGDPGELLALMNQSLLSPSRPERFHPMRSPWWIVPLVLFLGIEWWLRRRHGLP